MTQEPRRAEPVQVNEGHTTTERLLAKLCKQSFLSLWSYPSVFRDQGRSDGKGDGKEICDLLVVFENHILIFSDKDCEFIDTGRLAVDWSRWYRKAVMKSADQVFGAERWIKRFPQNLYLDRQCKQALPLGLPDPEQAIFHRIVVAHGGTRKCKTILGGSGSLMLDSTVAGDAHLNHGFTIGNVAPEKGFVHVFDDTTLDVVMSTLDTITDFTAYLTKKERLFTGQCAVVAAGEEDLLAAYLRLVDENGEHHFGVDQTLNMMFVPEGLWNQFATSPERRAQVEENEVSYAWDHLIEKFAFHAMTATQYYSTGEPLSKQETAFRWMAREPRTRRRALADGFLTLLKRSATSGSLWDARVLVPTNPSDPFYVFLCFRRPEWADPDEYRGKRFSLLHDYSLTVKMRWPDAVHIVGIATESGYPDKRSEDLTYLCAEKWDDSSQQEAINIQNRLGLLKKTRMTRQVVHEYPVDNTGAPRNSKPPSKNSPCDCGSGKRYRSCHGKHLFRKGGKRRDVRRRT